MNKRLQRQLRKMEQEADREREAAGLMSKRKLAAIIHSTPDLQLAILGAAAPQKGGKHEEAGKDQEEQARNTTATCRAGNETGR